jgi:two-component system, NtrC family, response regulator GlrR
MAARTTIAIHRTDANTEVAATLRRLLEGIPQDHVGQLWIEEVRSPGPKSFAGNSSRSQPDLAILLQPADAPSSAQADVARLKSACPRCPLIVVLPESLAPQALQLLEAGASDFILPPIRPLDLLPRVLHLLRPRESEDDLIAHLKQAAGARQIVGQSPILMAQLRKLPLFAGCDATVLITGETGTGKELCARAVHYCSRRHDKPFLAVDCGAIPADLIENELFGHERGAYTTALTAQPGLLQESAGGSLFLDEIHSLPLPMQSKLLRFLQEKEYRPLGSPKPRHVDVRVIAASNISLEDAVRAGRFRQDLYYRLNVLSLQMPPLRDRREDIPILARHFLEKYAAEFSRPARDITEEAVQKLFNYPWPGNARELENIVERAVLVCDAPLIETRDVELPASESDHAGLSYQTRKDTMVTKWELDELKRMLTTNRGNVSAVAKVEGKDPSAIRALLRKHQLRPIRESPYWDLRQ